LALLKYIDRTPGKGSFVSMPAVSRNIIDKKSFSEDMRSSGRTPGSRILEFKIVKAGKYPEIMKDLEMDPEESLYYIVRLRTGDDIPIALQESCLPVKYIEHLDLTALNDSLDEYIKNCGFEITGFCTRLKAVEGTPDQLDLLKTRNPALLKSVSIRFIANKIPFQYTASYYRSDLYEYSFSSFAN
jgi:DNA-binding GntR family transcriptional regulator